MENLENVGDTKIFYCFEILILLIFYFLFFNSYLKFLHFLSTYFLQGGASALPTSLDLQFHIRPERRFETFEYNLGVLCPRQFADPKKYQ